MIETKAETQDLISQLGREVVVSYEAVSATVTVIVTALLALQVQTPAVTLGTISGSYASLTRSIKVDGDTILRALYRLRDTVGGYIYVDNNRALQWTSSLGEDKGQQIRYRKNLKGIEREIDYKELYNRIYAYGAGEGDARIVLTAPGYVQDTDSQTEWGGIYPGVFIDKSITHPDTLLAWANLLLTDHANPVISYRIDTVDLSQSTELSFSFEALQLGSKVTVIDEDLGINVSVNVVKIEHPDLLHPENMTVDLANSMKDITDTLSEVYDIQQFNNHIATEIGAGQVIVNGTFTVLDWASAGETTINGANIKTGTVTLGMLNFVPLTSSGLTGAVIATINASSEGLTINADKISISRMDCMLENITWSYAYATNVLTWSAGDITYVDGGTKYKQAISTGNVTWTSGTVYIYYVKAGAAFSTTTTYSTAFGDDNIVLATYQGGAKLNVLIGKTTIEGGNIRTNTITADQITTGEFITLSAQIKDAIITNAKINDCSISKLTAGNLDVIGTITSSGKFRTAASGARIEITQTQIVGYNSSSLAQFYLQASDGKAYAGGGAVIIDSSGVLIDGTKLTLRSSGGTYSGQLYVDTSGVLHLDAPSWGWVYTKILQCTGSISTTNNLVADGDLYVSGYCRYSFLPYPTNAIDLGSSSYNWRYVYCRGYLNSASVASGADITFSNRFGGAIHVGMWGAQSSYYNVTDFQPGMDSNGNQWFHNGSGGTRAIRWLTTG